MTLLFYGNLSFEYVKYFCFSQITAIKYEAKHSVSMFLSGYLTRASKRKGSIRRRDFVTYITLLHDIQTENRKSPHESAHYTLRLTRSWYFMYGSLTYQFLLFQKEVVILSKSLLCVLLQNTCSLRRFRLAGLFFHSFFLYPALRRIQRPQCSLMNLSVTDFMVFLFPFFTL